MKPTSWACLDVREGAKSTSALLADHKQGCKWGFLSFYQFFLALGKIFPDPSFLSNAVLPLPPLFAYLFHVGFLVLA